MIKKRQIILKCGRVIFMKEKNPKDMVKADGRIVKELMKDPDEWDKFVSFNDTGRKRLLWAKRTYNKLASMTIKQLVEHLMKSDRVESATADNRFWMIAGGEYRHSRHVNWHTDGKTFGVRLSGTTVPYIVKLPRRRRLELEKRIKSGQAFHTV